jgi:hypothetical protein
MPDANPFALIEAEARAAEASAANPFALIEAEAQRAEASPLDKVVSTALDLGLRVGAPFASLLSPEDKAAPVPPLVSSRLGRFAQGVVEPAAGALQLAGHVGQVAQDIVNPFGGAMPPAGALPLGVAPSVLPLARSYADDLVKSLDRVYKSSRQQAGLQPGDWDYWAGLGQIAGSAAPIPAAPGAGLARTLGAGMGIGAGMGVSMPLVDTDRFAEQKLMQGILGAVGGGAGAALGKGLSKLAAPVSDKVRSLLTREYPVDLTPGQTLGMQRTENTLAHWPLVGPYIRRGQDESLDSFNRMIAYDVLKPLEAGAPRAHHTITPGIEQLRGTDLLTYVDKTLNDNYKYVLSRTSLDSTMPLFNNVVDLLIRAENSLLPDKYAMLDNLVNNQYANKLFRHNRPLSGDALQGMFSEIRAAERSYGDRGYDLWELQKYVREFREILDDELRVQNPHAVDALDLVNESWARFVRMYTAAADQNAVNRGNVFTPEEYSRAVSSLTKSTLKRATGQGLGRDLANDAVGVLPKKAYNSSAEQVITSGLIGGSALLSPKIALLATIIPGLYSKQGRGVVHRAALADRGKYLGGVSDITTRYSPGVMGRSSALIAPPQEESPDQGYADGGAAESPGYLSRSLEALGRIPRNLRQYWDDLPESRATDVTPLQRVEQDLNMVIDAPLRAVTGRGSPEALAALGLPTRGLEAGIEASRARMAPVLRTLGDIGAASMYKGPGASEGRIGPATGRAARLRDVTEEEGMPYRAFVTRAPDMTYPQDIAVLRSATEPAPIAGRPGWFQEANPLAIEERARRLWEQATPEARAAEERRWTNMVMPRETAPVLTPEQDALLQAMKSRSLTRSEIEKLLP